MLIAATGLVALIIEPLRVWISGTVDRLVWGARDDPLTVVRGVVEQVSADASGEGLLPALAGIVQRDLRVDAVAIDVRTPDGWRREAAIGPPTTYSRTVELDRAGARLVVIDRVIGPGRHAGRLSFHLGPDVDCHLEGTVARLHWPGQAASRSRARAHTSWRTRPWAAGGACLPVSPGGRRGSSPWPARWDASSTSPSRLRTGP